MSKPYLLDLFCGAGGAAMGYHRAGFDVVGVDVNPQPRYPFQFVQMDAFEFCERYGFATFNAIHASPPCQAYTSLAAQAKTSHKYPDLVDVTRKLLIAASVPYVIENVPGAPLRSPILLCGTMFGLRVLRHRLFESSELLFAPDLHPSHPRVWSHDKRREKPANRDEAFVTVTGWNFRLRDGLAAMGIDWMRERNELAQSIPPAYTEYIGKQLLAAL